MAGEEEQFQQLLSGLLSPDNEIRQDAENLYDAVELDKKLQLLLNALFDANLAEELRSMAAVLLRRFLSSNFEKVFPKLPTPTQTSIRGQLLANVLQESNPQLRRKICDVISELANALLDEEGNNLWPEFLHFLFEGASSDQLHHKEVALTLFSLAPGTFGNQRTGHLGMIRSMLLTSLSDTANLSVRTLAVKATTSFLLEHEKEVTIQKGFVELLRPMLQTIMDTIEQGTDESLLKSLVDIAESCPKFLRPELDSIIRLTIKVLSDENVPESFKHLLLEVVVTLCETAPGMMRRLSPKYLGQVIPMVLNMMTELEDEEDWSVIDELIDEDNDSSSVVAESSLDRLACGLGGKTVLPYLNSCLTEMLNSEDWKHRHAALMAISAVGEGCHKQMETMLNPIMDAIIVFLRDSHPRVRFAACNAVGQMATDFAPTFQKKFHEVVVPGLLAVMDDFANPRVQAHAGAALVNFSEVCPKNILTTYLPTIMSQLEKIMDDKFNELREKGKKLVLEQVITTIASVADTAEEHFVQYYDKFIPMLMYIIENACTPELRMLRGKTIECVSLIGLAVGPDKFMNDARKMMDLLLKTQTEEEEMSDDDPQVSYLISAWARVCKIMGKRFEPYLPLVMGPVLKTAKIKPEVALLDNEDMKTVDYEEDWQFVTIGEQQNFGIRTAGLEDKATACQMLVCYARELKEAFANYTEEVVNIMVPMLKFYFHDSVRTAAAESLPYLLECAKINGPQYLHDMWTYICPELLKAIETEPENEVLSEHMYSMAKCIEVLGSGCLTEEQMAELVKMLDKVLTNHFERAKNRHEKRKDEDYDEIVEEHLLDEDDEDTYALSKVSDVLHSLFSTYGTDFYPYFDALLPHMTQLLSAERSWPDHQWGLCIFDDVIEYGGPHCVKYSDHFLQPMVSHVSNKQSEVRQAAVYGCGVLAQFGGPSFSPICSQMVPLLVQVIQDPEARSEENINATENAISALTKILKYNNLSVNVDEVIPLWLSFLPVWEDADEAPHVYSYLCDLIDINHPAILGPNNSNLPKILAVVAEAFSKEAVERGSQVGDRMMNVVGQLQANPEVFSAVLRHLSQEQQLVLQTLVNGSSQDAPSTSS